MAVVWTTAFLDLPAPVHAVATEFWRAVTGGTVSSSRGEDDQFTTLLPPDGDAHLAVQRLGDAPRVHLDLHVDDVAHEADRAVALGATVVVRADHVVLRSPGGFVLCLVPDRGERTRPVPVPVGSGAALVDQVCLDVPCGGRAREVDFWSGLTGWPVRASSRAEMTVLDRPAGMPLRLMLHELGADDSREVVTAHLDLACGPAVEQVAAHHVALGASRVAPGHGWTVLRDPAGAVYCLTGRDPVTGLVRP